MREVVVEHPETGADHCFAAFAGRICDAEARAELGAIVVRNAHRNLQRLECYICRIVRLAAARGFEQAKRRLVTQAVIHGEMWSDAPGIFRVESEALHVLREAAVVGGSSRSAGSQVIEKYRGRLTYVISWILRERIQGFGIARKCAAQHRFVNEVDAEFKSVVASGVAYVVAELIFFLIAQVGEKSDGRGELIVAEGFESRNSLRRGAEGKCQRVAQSGIAGLGEMQFADVEYECTQPHGTECVSVADDRVPVIVMRGQAGGWERGLLHQSVVGEVVVFGGAQKPLRRWETATSRSGHRQCNRGTG